MLIINQTAIDLITSIGTIQSPIGPVILPTVYSRSIWGYASCLIFHGSSILITALFSSIIGLHRLQLWSATLVGIVHSIWHRKHYRPWMIKIMVTSPWVIAGVYIIGVLLTDTVIVNGHCCTMSYYPSGIYRNINDTITFVTVYILPVCTITFCYTCIALFIRRRSAVGVQNVSADSAQTNQTKRKLNVIKTLILISIVFAVSWLPSQIILLLNGFGYSIDYEGEMWSIVAFFHLLNLLLNPVMYAWQYESVSKAIKQLVLRSQEISHITQ